MVSSNVFSQVLGLVLRFFRKHGYTKHEKNVGFYSNQFRFQRFKYLVNKPNLSKHTMVFNVERCLLKSPSLFPYFMLVAFEGGSIFRALFLLLLYPFLCLISEKKCLEIMVMVSFFGIKQESFYVGRAALPKFFLEDVGIEGFETVKRAKTAVGVSNMPLVMIESFLKDYLNVEHVFGRELKVFHGYFLGVMGDKKNEKFESFEKMFVEKEMGVSDDVVGITSSDKFSDHDQLFSYCKEIYLTSKAEKMKWKVLPRDKYPKPLIFHDGRIAVRPTPLATLVIFMWIPIGLSLAILRMLIGLSLPYNISLPLLGFSGLQLRVSKPETTYLKNPLYVCNHRTLLDPLTLSFALQKNLTAVTYSISRIAEILAPIKTVRLTRDRDRDAKIMEKLLKQGSLVVCPEGTTCREPYLLRFSPLFAELSDEIVPVAINTTVAMFYGTTASGLKWLDPLFIFMNPSATCTVEILEKVSGLSMCHDQGVSRFDVANHVQNELGKALRFQCTKLTRKDKYMILAGNEGIVNS